MGKKEERAPRPEGAEEDPGGGPRQLGVPDPGAQKVICLTDRIANLAADRPDSRRGDSSQGAVEGSGHVVQTTNYLNDGEEITEPNRRPVGRDSRGSNSSQDQDLPLFAAERTGGSNSRQDQDLSLLAVERTGFNTSVSGGE